MKNRMVKQQQQQEQQILSPCSSGRRSYDSNSPEFEFWMVRNPSFPQPNLLSADELFSDGVLLPLHHLTNNNSDIPPDQNPEQPTSEPDPPPQNPEPDSEPSSCSGPELLSSSTLTTPSKRWKDIFKKSSNINSTNNGDDKGKEKKKDRKIGCGHGGGNGASSAELNINIWPFSRSRSAGNGGSRPKMVPGSTAARKVSSAPCSRSNSAGESKSRKWPSSPSRGGVHLGRSSPVWQVRRGGSGGRSSDPLARSTEKMVKKEQNGTRRSKLSTGESGGGGAKAKVLNLNVPMCIGYRHHLSCRSDENSAVAVAASAGGSGGQNGGGVGSGEGGRASNLFNLKGFFTKKVY